MSGERITSIDILVDNAALLASGHQVKQRGYEAWALANSKKLCNQVVGGNVSRGLGCPVTEIECEERRGVLG